MISRWSEPGLPYACLAGYSLWENARYPYFWRWCTDTWSHRDFITESQHEVRFDGCPLGCYVNKRSRFNNSFTFLMIRRWLDKWTVTWRIHRRLWAHYATHEIEVSKIFFVIGNRSMPWIASNYNDTKFVDDASWTVIIWNDLVF